MFKSESFIALITVQAADIIAKFQDDVSQPAAEQIKKIVNEMPKQKILVSKENISEMEKQCKVCYVSHQAIKSNAVNI